jgi:DNA modification methylase
LVTTKNNEPAQVEIINHIAVTDITVRDRFRKDLGDLEGLARDIGCRGLLTPILLRRSPPNCECSLPLELIDGERRLRACRDHLGRQTIDARLLDLDDLIDSQVAVNTLHKAFTLSEKVAIGLAMEARLGERRGGDHGNQHVGGKRQEFDEWHGCRTDAVAAERSGFGNRQTYRNAKRVVLAARQDPEKYRRLVERMDRSGKVDSAFRELKLIQRGENTLTKPVAIGTTNGCGQSSAVICGDSLVELDRLAEEPVGLVVTSPPYFNARPEYACFESYDGYLNFLRSIIQKCHRVLADGRFFVTVIAPVLVARKSRSEESVRLPLHFDIHRLFVEEGFDFIDDIVWEKPDGAGGQRGNRFAADRNPLAYKPVPVTEYVLVYRKKSAKLIDALIAAADPAVLQASKIGDGYERTNVWCIPPAKSDVHPAPFPLELAERIVRYYSFAGDMVLDPFAGTATTALAAQNLGRRFCVIEKNRNYLLERLPEFPNAVKRGL